MKKVIIAMFAALGVLFLSRGIRYLVLGAGAISIIGGADGPTSVFVAGSLGNSYGIRSLIVGLLLVLAVVAIYLTTRKKK